MIVQLSIFFSIFICAMAHLQADDFYVHGLPFMPNKTSFIRIHAGHLPVNPQHHGALFYWHFARKYADEKSRTVIWLNGGPGCSSLIGAWMEIGPFRFQDFNTIVENDGSCHLYANLLFIDQPVGTAFFYIDIETFPELLQDDI